MRAGGGECFAGSRCCYDEWFKMAACFRPVLETTKHRYLCLIWAILVETAGNGKDNV